MISSDGAGGRLAEFVTAANPAQRPPPKHSLPPPCPRKFGDPRSHVTPGEPELVAVGDGMLRI